MSDDTDVVWISSSHVLQRFDRPLLQYISQSMNVDQWEYLHDKDEGSSIDEAVDLIYEFLGQYSHPIHLAGHGAGGAWFTAAGIALTFARRYPQKVRSLVLLAVASQPANTWHVHYYLQRKLFTMSREQVLASCVRHIFGEQPHNTTKMLMAVLCGDLEESPLLHSLFKLIELPKGGVFMPLMVCGSKNDIIVNSSALKGFKPEDHLWECPKGYHFFHYFYPQKVCEQMLSFWQPYHLQSMLTSQLVFQNLTN
ncbi:MAG: alpha/beta hydrolase [Nostoc sp. NMS7]|uniref:alpha/beta fold hydrolase n=1 Tax=Nostoc sp. NMS7 TaxID=2815391 RepID=UPI0025DD8824|nr:alpha/beta hydrolase [Nostoc sp. NMS7]MBN3946197.1 alpha/beta hydrolase [Nostoc sp. NMS7]